MVGQRSTGTTANNYWFDSTRGVGKYMISNSGTSQSTDANSITAFGTDGFSLGSSGGYNTSKHLSFSCWKANGGTTSTNTSGTITSTVQANHAGFSIVKYTGNRNKWYCGSWIICQPDLCYKDMKDGGLYHIQ